MTKLRASTTSETIQYRWVNLSQVRGWLPPSQALPIVGREASSLPASWPQPHIPALPSPRKAVKATLVLLPLLGITYMLFFVNPGEDDLSQIVFIYFNSFLQSFQVRCRAGGGALVEPCTSTSTGTVGLNTQGQRQSRCRCHSQTLAPGMRLPVLSPAPSPRAQGSPPALQRPETTPPPLPGQTPVCLQPPPPQGADCCLFDFQGFFVSVFYCFFNGEVRG